LSSVLFFFLLFSFRCFFFFFFVLIRRGGIFRGGCVVYPLQLELYELFCERY
jgi:hypothetical protein